MKATREPQYQVQVDSFVRSGPVHLGLTTSHLWRSDPKHLVFYLSRYKFVSKMLAGYSRVLEVGCGDGFGSRLLTQNGTRVHCTDFDPTFIEEAARRDSWDELRTFEVMDFSKEVPPGSFQAAYALDVIEHIPPEFEGVFLSNICRQLVAEGVCLIGAPSLESQTYASEWSKQGHVNCKSGQDLQDTLARYFGHVFMFSMNDEVVHTGFQPMAHYLFALCVSPKASS